MKEDNNNPLNNENSCDQNSYTNPQEPAQTYTATENQQPWQNERYNQQPHPPYGYGYPPYNQPPYGQPPYGQPPYSQPTYNQPPFYGQGNGTPPQDGQFYGGYPYPPYGYPSPGFYYAPSPEEIKKQQEKAKIKKLGNAVCIPLCLVSVISFILSSIVSNVLLVLLGRDAAVGLLTNPDFTYIFSALVSALCFTFPFLITSTVTGHRWSETISFKRTSSTKFLAVVMLGLGICSLSNYASSFISSFLEQTTGQGSQTSMTEFGTGWLSFGVSFVCVGILPALLEEFAFRGVILGNLRRHMSDGASILVSATLFALLHGNLQQIPFAFGVGLALGFATVYCDSIIPALVLHGINNCMAVIMDFATRNLNPFNSQLVTLLYLAVLLLVGLCGFIMLSVSDKDAFRLSGETAENSKEKIKYFTSSIGAIIFIVITVLSVLAVQFG